MEGGDENMGGGRREYGRRDENMGGGREKIWEGGGENMGEVRGRMSEE